MRLISEHALHSFPAWGWVYFNEKNKDASPAQLVVWNDTGASSRARVLGNVHVDSEKIWAATLALLQSDLDADTWPEVIFKTNEEDLVWPEVRSGDKDKFLPSLPEEVEEHKHKRAKTSPGGDPWLKHDPWKSDSSKSGSRPNWEEPKKWEWKASLA